MPRAVFHDTITGSTTARSSERITAWNRHFWQGCHSAKAVRLPKQNVVGSSPITRSRQLIHDLKSDLPVMPRSISYLSTMASVPRQIAWPEPGHWPAVIASPIKATGIAP
jgi:hypothetical protein